MHMHFMIFAFAPPTGLQSLRLACKVHSLVRVSRREADVRKTHSTDPDEFHSHSGYNTTHVAEFTEAQFLASQPVCAVHWHSTEARTSSPSIRQPLSQ